MKLLKFVLPVLLSLCLVPRAWASIQTQNVSEWIKSQIIRMAPPGQTWSKDAAETEEQALERYGSITSDLIQVVYDPDETPVFSGPRGRAKTAALMLSIANFESGGFRRDVDLGIGNKSRGDSGESHCLMQVRLSKIGPDGSSRKKIVLDSPLYSFSKTEGLDGSDLVQDRKNCFRSALHIIRHSMKSCSSKPIAERLGIYTSGHCDRGINSSKIRMNMALSIYGSGKMEKDSDVMNRWYFSDSSESPKISSDI